MGHGKGIVLRLKTAHQERVDIVLEKVIRPVEVGVHLVDGIISPQMVELVAGCDLGNGDIGIISKKINHLEALNARIARNFFFFGLSIVHVENSEKMEDVSKIEGLETLHKDLNGAIHT